MKKLFLLYIFAASAMFTGGCSANMSNESKTMAADVAAAVPTDKQELEFTRFSLFYEKPENFEQYSLLETDEIYSGCSIYSNKSFGSIDEYESKTGLNNKIYSYSINLGQDYPEEFVLSCIACGKIPNIIICPPKEGELFDKEMLKKTAESFAAYKTPLFVQFYPVFPEYDRKEYINFFRMAKKTFTAFSPNSAFVWNVPAEYIRECTSLYPGATYADWVGITLYTNPEQYYDAITAVSDFYAEYAENSPVMISEFGVSHYSPKDNVYETKEAAEFISNFLAEISLKFPRLKAVIYSDVDLVPDGENYSISEEPELIEAFLSYNRSGLTYEKSRFFATSDGDDIYVPEYALLGEMGFDENKLSELSFVTIDYKKYYATRLLESSFGTNVINDYDKKEIFIS